MFEKVIHFIKYNNLTVLLVLAIFLATGGVFAQTPVGQEIIGQEEKRFEGIDNTLLLTADLDNFNMDFKIEKIEEDEKYFYVTYTYLGLIQEDNAWQYLIQEKIKKISKKLRLDLGVYLAEQFKQEYEAHLKDLRLAKDGAEKIGTATRTEVVAYTGLIGRILDFASGVIPGYEPIKRYEVPSPSVPPTVLQFSIDGVNAGASATDGMASIYDNYIKENDPDDDNIFGSLDNCPNYPNPDQLDSDNDGIGDLCDTDKGEKDIAETATTTEAVSGDNQEATNEESDEEMTEEPTEDPTDEPVEEPTDVQVIELPTE